MLSAQAQQNLLECRVGVRLNGQAALIGGKQTIRARTQARLGSRKCREAEQLHIRNGFANKNEIEDVFLAGAQQESRKREQLRQRRRQAKQGME